MTAIRYRYNPIDPKNIWTDSGLNILSGELLTFFAQGRINLHPPQPHPYSMLWVGPDGCLSDDDCDFFTDFLDELISPSHRPGELLVRIGGTISGGGTIVGAGRQVSLTAPSTGRIYLGMNDIPGTYGDNRGSFQTMTVIAAPPQPISIGDCGTSFTTTGNPIDLKTGNKLWSGIDLTLQSATGALNFERLYNQEKRDESRYQFMGLGWSHNHAEQLLIAGTSPTRTAILYLPNGGEIRFLETATNIFTVQRGSLTTLEISGSDYLYTRTDKSQIVFEATSNPQLYRVAERRWSNGEVWTYAYDATSGSLLTVSDDYGRSLQFLYRPSGAFDAGQLWRVGDHTVSNLASPGSNDRYIEFTYTETRLNGTITTPAKALLAQVRDVRGQVWAYQYYGQQSGQSYGGLLNFLLKRLSPSVDTTGDGAVDGALTLEELVYASSGPTTPVQQKRGNNLLVTGFAFDSNLTTETIAGQEKTHYFVNSVYMGTRPGGDLEQDPDVLMNLRVVNEQYRPLAQFDPNGNQTQLEWSGDGKTLIGTRDAINNDTLFVYDAAVSTDDGDRLRMHTGVDGRKTLYLYDAKRRQPMMVLREPAQNLITNGTMEGSGGWSTIFPAAHANATTQVDTGTYSRNVTTTAADAGIQSTTWDLLAHHSYFIQARVYVVSGLVKMKVSGTTDFDVLSTTTGTWETLRILKTASASSTGVTLQFITPNNSGQFYVDNVVVYQLGEIELNGGMEVAGGWSDVGTPTTNAVSTAQVDSGVQSRQVVCDAAGEGIESAAWDVRNARTYLAYARVYLSSGAVKLRLTDGTNELASVVHSQAGWATLRLLHASIVTSATARLQVLSNGGAASFYVDSVHLVETKDLQEWQEFLFDDRGRTLAERTLVPSAGIVQRETTRSYYTTGNGDGLLETLTQVDTETPANNTSTTYTYDSAGRVSRTQQSSLFGSCSFTYTLYDVAGNVTRTVCSSASVASPETATTTATTKVTVHEYDALGRRFKTTSDFGASNAQTILTVYDALDRVVRTIQHYVPDAGIPNPFTAAHSAFSHGTDNTENRVTDTVYNARGQVRKTVDVLGSVTLYGYDDLGRQVKIIRSASQPNYNNDYSGVSPDARLASYVPSALPDQDVVSTTEYDGAGNVVQTVDPLGNAVVTIYDTLNRAVKVIRNPKDGATFDLKPTDVGYVEANDLRSDNYVPDAAADRDVITRTVYDNVGRPFEQINELGRVTRTVYDSQGRVSKMITNYVAQGGTDPAAWVWDNGSDQRWERADGTPIDHGANNDQNLISLTVYGTDNRVLYTQDVLGRRSWTKVDGLGRAIKTISNAVGTATDGGTSDPRSDTYSVSSDSDKDHITRTEYDADGRVKWTQDAHGRKTWQVYDAQGRQVKTIVNCTYVSGSPAPEDAGYVGSSSPDQDIITRTEYDTQGRVWKTFDPLGRETRFEYDILGRRTKTITNYVNGVYSAAAPDEDLIETTTYDLAGRVASTIDARGTKTTFTYDALGQRKIVTQAADSPLEGKTYTGYDKAGRVQRTIHNWRDTGVSPDAKDGQGNWLFVPANHGALDDRDLISSIVYDRVGRVISTRNAVGDVSSTTYNKAGQVVTLTDPLGVVTTYRYDAAQRRGVVVQNYLAQGSSDPSDWHWNGTNWQRGSSDATAIVHGANNDQNVIVKVTHDNAGRMTSLRNPRGQLTTYTYDLLDRRLTLTNPLSKTWTTTYTDVAGGTTSATLTDPNSKDTRRTFDRLGRMQQVEYLTESPKLTPDVAFTYDKGGNRLKMSESNGVSTIRETNFGYDDVRRLTSVGFDNDGSGVVDQTVSYEYDAGGRRTKLTMPGNLSVIYTYDVRGQLVSLTDWDTQMTTFHHDLAGRHVLTERNAGTANTIQSRYQYDAAGRLRLLRHRGGGKTLAQFGYDVDARGNRVRATELVLRHPVTTTTLTYLFNDPGVSYRGTWSDASPFKVSTGIDAAAAVAVYAKELSLTFGTGPDHGLFDVYVGGSLWESFDGYAAATGERTVTLMLPEALPYIIELRNRRDKNVQSSGNKLRFKQVVAQQAYPVDFHTIFYAYDALSRVHDVRYSASDSWAAVTPHRRYQYAFDLAGNRTQQIITIGGSATTTNYTYNAVNQLTSDGTNTLTYDNNGNLTSDGVNTYAWDRANRLLSMGGSSYAYDGAGNRISQTVGANVTQYLLDLQPGLATVLSDTTGANTSLYIHSPRGIHAQKDTAGNWEHALQDGLGSVRGVVDNTAVPLESRQYEPYGVPFGITGTSQTAFGFTGEMYDGTSEQLFLRARYYRPAVGVFTALDPWAGRTNNAMSLNGYSWVEGNPILNTDPSGFCTKRTLNEAETDFNVIQRCQTQVANLNNLFEVGLTQVDGLEFNDVWTTTRVQNVYSAVLAVAYRYSTIGFSFANIFGGMTMTIQTEAQRYCGLTPGSENISWYQCSDGNNDPYSRDNVIHELGHILQNRAGNINGFSMPATWDAIERRSQYQDEIIQNPGLGFSNPVLRQNGRALVLNENDRWAEEVSDMFLFWVAGYGFSSGGGLNGEIGDLRRAFINGETLEYAQRDGGNIENPGMVGWARNAVRESGALNPKDGLIDYLTPIYNGGICL